MGCYFCFVITPEILLLLHIEYVNLKGKRLRMGEKWGIEKGNELLAFVFIAVGCRMGGRERERERERESKCPALLTPCTTGSIMVGDPSQVYGAKWLIPVSLYVILVVPFKSETGWRARGGG